MFNGIQYYMIQRLIKALSHYDNNHNQKHKKHTEDLF